MTANCALIPTPGGIPQGIEIGRETAPAHPAAAGTGIGLITTTRGTRSVQVLPGMKRLTGRFVVPVDRISAARVPGWAPPRLIEKLEFPIVGSPPAEIVGVQPPELGHPVPAVGTSSALTERLSTYQPR